MGLSSARCWPKRLAEKLNISLEEAEEAVSYAAQGGFATIWGITPAEKYTDCRLTTQTKRMDTGEYETDFQDSYVKFVGAAHKKIKDKVLSGEKAHLNIKIIQSDAQKYVSSTTQKVTTRWIVYDFEFLKKSTTNHSGTTAKAKSATAVTSEYDDELPF